MDPTQINELFQSCAKIGERPIYIDDRSGLDATDICRSIRKMKKEVGIEIAFIDYIQKIKGDGDRRIVVGDAASDLKNLAKELNIPIVVLAQINRKVDERDDKRPVPSDLKESGDIEQEADVIILLYRDEYYNATSSLKGILEMDIAKYRNGQTGVVNTKWDGKAQDISSLQPGRR